MTQFASSRSDGQGRKKTVGTAMKKLRTAHDLDRLHDRGVDVSAHLDLARARRPGREVQRVNVDFPLDLLHEIDAEARRIGINRQAYIKLRLADAVNAR
jgi:hypothetical protein